MFFPFLFLSSYAKYHLFHNLCVDICKSRYIVYRGKSIHNSTNIVTQGQIG